MSKLEDKNVVKNVIDARGSVDSRRQALRKLGRYAAVTAPTVTLLMAAGAKAQTPEMSADPVPPPISSRQFKVAEGQLTFAYVRSRAQSSPLVATSHDVIDHVGLCLAAIQDLAARIDALSRS